MPETDSSVRNNKKSFGVAVKIATPILIKAMKDYNNFVYPAIFRKSDEGGYLVEFPDLHGFTEGDNLTEAFNMAGDCLLAMIDCEDIAALPKPTPLESIKVKEGDYVMLVKPCYFDINAARSVTQEEDN